MFHYWETFYFKNWTYWYSRWNHKVVIDFKEIYPTCISFLYLAHNYKRKNKTRSYHNYRLGLINTHLLLSQKISKQVSKNLLPNSSVISFNSLIQLFLTNAWKRNWHWNGSDQWHRGISYCWSATLWRTWIAILKQKCQQKCTSNVKEKQI